MPGNILFIMCDQLRWDYLSCYGHPTLHTPNIDALAARGVRFDRAYCQSPLCGPSRASFYSGRYMSSHGVMANNDPSRIDELTISDYLRPAGYRSALVGKAHHRKHYQSLLALGLDADSEVVRNARSGGFEPFELHDGLLPGERRNGYSEYLRSRGYDGANPWHDYANSGVDSDGNPRSGWQLRHSVYPARVAEKHSETAFTTDRALDFLDAQSTQRPWCLHLSYIKPHWPLIAPAPYHERYRAADRQAANRAESERRDAHPVYRAFMDLEYSASYARDEVLDCVVPAYMGLVKQIDDHLGRVFERLRERGMLEDTLVVFTSDHGDYLGDHWLGEKDLFHEPSVRIPLIVVDPRSEADATRGTHSTALVEAIDLLPTFTEFAGVGVCHERVEGRSLLPLLHAATPPANWRDFTVSEIDYAERAARTALGLDAYQCRATMIRTPRWKYIDHACFRPQLYDLETDPLERVDLGDAPNLASTRGALRDRLIDWRRRLKPRIGVAYEKLAQYDPAQDEANGIIIGRW